MPAVYPQKASSNALGIAVDAKQVSHEARQEADSFEKDIVSAKTQAAEAESHLAEALREAADASAELKRIKAPRSLVDTAGLVSALKPFSATEFMFGSVFGDSESIELLKQIDAALASAGWRRIKHPEMTLGISAIQISGRDDLVDINVSTGVRVEVEVTAKPGTINPSIRTTSAERQARCFSEQYAVSAYFSIRNPESRPAH